METQINLISLILLFDSYTLIIKIVLILLLIFGSALISGSEVAFFSLSNTDIKKAAKSSNKALNLISTLRNKPRRLLAVLLVSNNFINISIVLLLSSFGELFNFYLFPSWLDFVLEVGFITLLILLFGEILPKVYAHRNPIEFSKKMALPIQILDKYIFFFLTIPMSNVTEFIQRKLVFRKTNLSVDKLSDALELTDKSETSKDEQKILNGIVSFGSLEVKQIMKPRIDVFSVSDDISFTELIKTVKQNNYSRIPVYQEKIDKVIGVIYLKDLFPYLNKIEFNWNSLIRDPYFIPENKKLDDLLKEFQKLKMHLAVVVDEYGGNSGIVTMDDIVEEIVGDINDNLNQDDIQYSKIDNNNYIFEGKTNLNDLYRVIDVSDQSVFESKKGDSETLAGFILEQIRFFPKKGYSIEVNNVTFTINEVDKKRIKKIMVSLKK